MILFSLVANSIYSSRTLSIKFHSSINVESYFINRAATLICRRHCSTMAESTCLKEVVVAVNIWGWNCVDSKAHELKGSNSD